MKNWKDSFGGEDVYSPLEAPLYFVTKIYSFSDINKLIAATVFLYFLDKNGLLYNEDSSKRIADHTLVTITIMITESRTKEKEMMVSIIMDCI